MAHDTVAKRLRWAREKHGRFKTPTEAAEAFNGGKSTYMGYENADRIPSRRSAKKIARMYGVRWEWLLEGEGAPKMAGVVPVEGFVGAGAEFRPFDDSNAGLGDAPAMVEANSAAVIVRGDSMYPRYFDGEYLYYVKDHRPPTELYGAECIVKLKDGRMFVKILRRGSSRGLYNLESWNASVIEDQAIEWAAPVTWRRG